MKKIHIFTVVTLMMMMTATSTFAQTYWTGPKITFTKANFADWTQAPNQDRLTNNVWITRANSQSIFNIADMSDTQAGDCAGSSPSGTEWAFGSIADGVETLTFGKFLSASFAACTPPSILNQNAVLHLIAENIYIDIKFTSWSQGGTGGGISYERSTNPLLATAEYNIRGKVKVTQVPACEYIQISGLEKTMFYQLYSTEGLLIKEGNVSNNTKLSIIELTPGTYILKLDDGTTLKFIKI